MGPPSATSSTVVCIWIMYSRAVLGMLRRVVERVCLPAGSAVTHDFAGDSKVASGSLECERPAATPWNLLVNHRRRRSLPSLTETNLPVASKG